MSIEGISIDHFSALPQTEIKLSTKSCPHHAVFQKHLSDDNKQYSDTTTLYRKSYIELLKIQKVLTSSLSTIWENTDGCAEQFICASALYILSFLSQCYSIIIYQGMSSSVPVKDVVVGINSIYKRYIYSLMSNVQLMVSNTFD